jgi:HEAT repeat protein
LTGELAKLGDAESLKGIRDLVRSEDPVERVFAAEVLGEARKGEVAEELVKALDDPDPVVRLHAATAILRALRTSGTGGAK